MKIISFVRTALVATLFCWAGLDAAAQQAYRFTITRVGTDASDAASATMSVESKYGQPVDGMSGTITGRISNGETTYVAHNVDKGVALSTNLTSTTASYTITLHGLPSGMVVRSIGLGTNGMALGVDGTQTSGSTRGRQITITAANGSSSATTVVDHVETDLLDNFTAKAGISHINGVFPFVRNTFTPGAAFTTDGSDITLTIGFGTGSNGIVPAIRDITISDEVNIDYSTNHDGKKMTRTSGERKTNSVSINTMGYGEQTINVGQTYTPKGELAFDLTWGQRFRCLPGALITPSVNFTGGAMNTYVYVDEDKNGFSASADDIVNNVLLTGTGVDLKSFSRYGSYNSLGASVAANEMAAPAFTAPTTPGIYRMRILKEWNAIEPKGRTDDNSIAANGGAIVDVTLDVTETIVGDEYRYQVNYAPNSTSTNTSRFPSSLTVKDDAGTVLKSIPWATAVRHKLYTDNTSQIVNVYAGAPVELAISYNHASMHAYAYIDFGNDGWFSYGVDPSTHGRLAGSDLVSWSQYSNYDSNGNSHTGNGQVLPKFDAPQTPGDYRVRVKIDWNNIDPAGATTSNSGGSMQNNGGAIMDFMIHVLPNPTVTLNFVLEGNTANIPFTAISSNVELAAQNKIQRSCSALNIDDFYVVTGWKLNGTTYGSKADFMAAVNALTTDATATITMRWNDIISHSYGEHWVTIRNNGISGNNYATTYDDSGTSRIKLLAPGSGGNANKWCFVPTDGGFYIYNKGMGDSKVVTLDGDAGDGTAISMQEISTTNPERQKWTLVYNGSSWGIVPANNTNRGWNPYAADTNPLKLYDVTGTKSRWQIIESGKSSYTDRDGNPIEDGGLYTIICAYEGYYSRQGVYKAVYVNTTDNLLYWKTYDPSDDTFYFRAHVDDNSVVTMECVGKPGYYMTGPATAVAESGNAFTLQGFGDGSSQVKVYVNGGTPFHTANHVSGAGSGSNIIGYNGNAGSASAWYLQRADNKTIETARYQKELADRLAAINEAARQAKRAELKAAIDAAAAMVGYELGQYPQEAVDAAQEVYDDPNKTTAEYQTAITVLQGSINPPQANTYFRIKTAFAWNDGEPRYMYVGKDKVMRWQKIKESLFQLWQVTEVNENDHSQIALLNLGSGTYMKIAVNDGATTTTSDPSFIKLEGTGTENVYYIKTITPISGRTCFHTGDHESGAGTDGRMMPYDGDRNTWMLEEVSDIVMSDLAYDEDNRVQARANLLACINEMKMHSTAYNSIAYRQLGTAIAAAQTVYDDESNTKAEYLAAIDALRAADAAATVIEPVAGQTYVLMKADGSLAIFMDNPEAEDDYGRIAATVFDDTDETMLWTIAHSEGNAYTFTCNEVSVTLNLTPAGNDQYRIDNLSDIYGNFVIRPCTLAEDHDYLGITEGMYRLVNVSTGKAFANNGLLVAQTTMANVDETCTDHLQIWTVTKLPGADRYMLRNVETGRHLGQPEVTLGTNVTTAPLASVYRLVESDTEGQYYLYTTQGMGTQLCLSYNNNQPQLRGADNNAKWTFVPVEPQEKPVVSYQAVRIRNYGKSTHYMSAVEMNVQHKTITISDNDEKDMWVLVPHDFTLEDGIIETRYALRNAFSGLYMQNVTSNDQKVSAGTTPVYYIKTTSTLYANTVEFKSPTNAQKLNASGGNEYIIGWDGARDKNSHWYIEDVEGKEFTEDELMVRADAYEGFCAPADGLIVRVYNPSRGTYLDEDYNARGPRHNGLNTAKYTQLWRLHYDEAEAMYSIENLYTGDYLRNQPSQNAQFYLTDDVATAGMFTVACNPTIVGQRMYNFIDSRSGRYVHAQAGGLCVTWTAGNGNISASEWRFKPVTLSDEEIATIKAKWEENKNMIGNRAKYQGILDQIFADKACTTIKDDLTDERFAELVDQLPDLLADMCNKIKDNTWTAYESGRNWEKAFRIAEHSVMSNHSAMSGLVAVDYGFSRLNDPTGIKAVANEIVAIMVDSDIPAGTLLKVECQSGFAMSGGQITLNKGLNLVAMEQDSNLFIYYMIDSGADDPSNYVANYPDIKIHIEGGEVFGKLDRTRIFEVEKTTDGVTTTERYDMLSHHAWSQEAEAARQKADELWVNMQADGLLTNGYMTQVKSETILFNFASSEFLAACPDKIGEVTDIWDWIMKSEQFILGMRNNWTLEGQNGELIDTYIPNFSKRFRNLYMATERTGGYMNATGYGAMYTVGTAASILNFNALKAGGAIWGPAHEHGHDHQKLINMIGMSEVSNNLFSNVANYYHGTMVSRGASLPDVMNNYVNGGHWFDLSIWNMTQMYYKLFLYYHAAHNMDDFYPLVFKKLRDGERIRRVQGTAVGAHEDYLRFALVCSEVAGEDLSEFFEAYGMFREISPEVSNFEPVEKNGKQCRYVGDYGDFYIYTDMDKVAEVKAKIQACGPRNSVVLFAEDRVSREEATNPFSQPGELKANRGDGGVVGQYGNVGQYSDFDKNSDDYSEDKTTGFMIYDEDGNLLYFTATATEQTDDNGNTVTVPVIPQTVIDRLPEGITADDLVVGEVEANGDIIEQADEDDKVFTLTTYQGSADTESSINSAGRLKPNLGPNEILVVSHRTGAAARAAARIIYARDRQATVRRLIAGEEEYRFADLDNVVIEDNDGELTMHSLNVTDKINIYLPGEVATEQVTYKRSNTAGWNSVCLPFAVTNEDFGAGSQIYTLESQDDSYITLVPVNGVVAGEPCYVLCPQTVTEWNISRQYDDMTTTEVTVQVNDDVQINGSFTNKAIGAGKYKMNTAGTKFGVTSASGNVTAFRSYIEAKEGVSLSARQFILRIGSANADSIDERTIEMQPGVMYDLNGNRIVTPVSGKPYIINGKVVVAK